MTKWIAVLDTNKRLVGKTEVSDDAPGVDPGDLALNGSYKYDEANAHFVPLGHGFGKVKTRPPHTEQLVMARMIEAMGQNAPFEAQEWLAWYNADLRRRDEEFSAKPK